MEAEGGGGGGGQRERELRRHQGAKRYKERARPFIQDARFTTHRLFALFFNVVCGYLTCAMAFFLFCARSARAAAVKSSRH